MILARKLQRGAPRLLLDTFPGALFAYAFRKLSASATLSFRVRRSSDNAEQDIGFTGDGLDTSSLLSFVGAGNGFVVTLYDQSGNANNATNSTAAHQFQIVASGALVTQGGLPYMQGVNSSLGYDSGGLPSTNSATFSVLNTTPRAGASGVNNSRILSGFAGAGPINNELLIDAVNNNGSPFVRYFDGAVTSHSTAGTHTFGLHLISATRVGSALNLYEDGASIGSGSGASGTGVNTMHVGEDTGSGADGEQPSYMAEVVFYNSDQAANRAAIESAINGYYGVY